MGSKFDDQNEQNASVQRAFWRSDESYNTLREGFRNLFDKKLGAAYYCKEINIACNSKTIERFVSKDPKWNSPLRNRRPWLTNILVFCAKEVHKLPQLDRMKDAFVGVLQLHSDYARDFSDHSVFLPSSNAHKLKHIYYSKDELLCINSAISAIKRDFHDDPRHPEFPYLRPQFPSTPTVSTRIRRMTH